MKLAELRGTFGQVKSAEKIRAAALESIEHAVRRAPQFASITEARSSLLKEAISIALAGYYGR